MNLIYYAHEKTWERYRERILKISTQLIFNPLTSHQWSWNDCNVPSSEEKIKQKQDHDEKILSSSKPFRIPPFVARAALESISSSRISKPTQPSLAPQLSEQSPKVDKWARLRRKGAMIPSTKLDILCDRLFSCLQGEISF